MALHPRGIHKRRESLTALPLYHSGHLQKKHSKDKDFTRFYAELRGSTVFLYKDDTQTTYLERMDLELMKSLKLESPYNSKMPTIFSLSLPSEVVQLKMDNADTGEVWRGYILTVAKKEIPSKLQLLPGQMLLLQETLDLEKSRNPELSRPRLPPRPPFLKTQGSGGRSPVLPEDVPDDHSLGIPSCFFDVTRQEAERMLEKNPECGGIILRPATMANNYALTIRQMTPSGSCIKNYRVSSTRAGFVIELDTPVTVATLNEALQFFIEKTEYRLIPYTESQPYDTNIGTLPPVPKFISSTSSAASKKVPQAQVTPMPRPPSTKELPPLPAKPEDGDYMEPNDPNLDVKQDSFHSELQGVLKHRREAMKTESEDEEGHFYVNPQSDRSTPKTAHWE